MDCDCCYLVELKAELKRYIAQTMESILTKNMFKKSVEQIFFISL